MMLAVEFLGRLLAGADSYAVDRRGGPTMRHQGVSFIAIDPAIHQSVDLYNQRARELTDRVRASPPAPGFREVLVPGDPERRAREERSRSGIAIPSSTWDDVLDLARSLGITI